MGDSCQGSQIHDLSFKFFITHSRFTPPPPSSFSPPSPPVLQFFFPPSLPPSLPPSSSPSPLPPPRPLGAWLDVVLPLCLGSYLKRTWRPSRKFWKLLFLFISVSSSSAILPKSWGRTKKRPEASFLTWSLASDLKPRFWPEALCRCRRGKVKETMHAVRRLKSDQNQSSPAASPEISHHTVWRTWLFIA